MVAAGSTEAVEVSTAEGVVGSTEAVAEEAFTEAAATTEASLAHVAGTVARVAVSAADLAVDLVALAAVSTRLAEGSAVLMAVRRQARAASANAMALAAISAAACGVPDLIRAWVQRSTHGADTPPLVPALPTGTGTALAGPLEHLPLPGAASERGLALAAALARA